ncbi:hypothetical protein AMECASPLE_036805 [Ameca splendens]|uniref:Uncharacterized protein n=1 Tax=Ameca splendens TaxID=208324 RepID=A0ABV0YJ77_9TELE
MTCASHTALQNLSKCRGLGNLLPAAYCAYSPDGVGAPCRGVQQVSLIINQVLRLRGASSQHFVAGVFAYSGNLLAKLSLLEFFAPKNVPFVCTPSQVFLTSWLQSWCRSSGKIPSTTDFKLPHLLSSSWLTPSSKPPSNLQANLAHPPTISSPTCTNRHPPTSQAPLLLFHLRRLPSAPLFGAFPVPGPLPEVIC